MLTDINAIDLRTNVTSNPSHPDCIMVLAPGLERNLKALVAAVVNAQEA